MEGWIKIHRLIQSWEWYDDSKMVHLFLHLLLSANHKDGSWRGIKIKRGQLIFGRKKASERTGISERSIRTCLDKLKSTEELTIKTTNRYSIITVCKYEDYQLKESDTDQPEASNRPATDQQTTTNKKDKNDKKEKKEKNDKKYKYVDEILNEFIEAYSVTGNDYEILNKGKERAAIGKLLKLYKDKWPDKTSDETKIGLRVYFDAVVQISDNWLSQNMSPSIIISKFNEINKILKDGTNKGRGTSDKQLAEILVKHLGEDA